MPDLNKDRQKELELVIRDKYNGDRSRVDEIAQDKERLAEGEPLAYVIGWIPFLGLKIFLEAPSHSGADSEDVVRPLIPRSETEWWTEKLVTHLHEKFGTGDLHTPFHLLDLCAGSGAIGLAILKEFPNAEVSFGELVPELAALIQKNIRENGLDESRADIAQSNLFEAFEDEQFDIIATNPPYIPSDRELEESVIDYEPYEALFAGSDGLSIIREILLQANEHLQPGGELWMECDTSNIGKAAELVRACGAHSVIIHDDLSSRPRLLVAHF